MRVVERGITFMIEVELSLCDKCYYSRVVKLILCLFYHKNLLLKEAQASLTSVIRCVRV